MRVTIVTNPFFDRKVEKELLWPPYFLGIIKAELEENNIDTKTTDLNIEMQHYNNNNTDKIDFSFLRHNGLVKDYLDNDKLHYKLENNIKKVIKPINKSGIIIFSITDNSQFSFEIYDTLITAKYLKENYNPIIVFAGPYLFNNKNNQKFDFIDYRIYSKFIDELPECIKLAKDNCKQDVFDNYPYKDDFEQKFVMPDFSDLPIDYYKYSLEQINRCYNIDTENIEEITESRTRIGFLPFQFMQGCQNKCNFCGDRKIRFKFLEPEKAADDIISLGKKYNMNNFLFMNNNLNISREYLEKFCSMLRDENIKWSDSIRADRLDEKQIRMLKKAGAVRLSFGVESPSPRMLKFVNKQLDINKAIQTLKLCDRNSIWNSACFIVGFPYEQRKDIYLLQRFIRDFAPYIDQIVLNMFLFNSGSYFYKYPEKFNIKLEQDSELKDEIDYPYPSIGFSEAKGLSWQDKIQQTIRRYKSTQRLVLKSFPENKRKLMLDNRAHLIHYLDTFFEDKEQAKRWIESLQDGR